MKASTPITESRYTICTGSKEFDRWKAGKVFSLESPDQTGDHLHHHDYYQIWYVERGRCRHWIEGQLHVMDTGDVFILPPGMTHRTVLLEDSKILCCEFMLNDVVVESGDAYYRKLREITQGISFSLLFRHELEGAKEKFTLSARTGGRIQRLMHTMLEEYEEQELIYEDILQLQVLELLLLLMREFATLPYEREEEGSYAMYRPLIDTAIDYIDTHYDESLTLEGMCRRAAMSRTYFCYLFKMATQKTFKEYLTDTRIRHAKEKLVSTSRPVSLIATDTGFSDPSNFSRTFRQHVGMPPSAYRHKFRHAARH